MDHSPPLGTIAKVLILIQTAVATGVVLIVLGQYLNGRDWSRVDSAIVAVAGSFVSYGIGMFTDISYIDYVMDRASRALDLYRRFRRNV